MSINERSIHPGAYLECAIVCSFVNGDALLRFKMVVTIPISIHSSMPNQASGLAGGLDASVPERVALRNLKWPHN